VIETLTATHYKELELSAIAPDIARLNFVSIDQTEAFKFVIKNPSRRNDGRLTDRYLRIYNKLGSGGWICTGIDPLTMTPSTWGCLKPNDPRWDEEKRKHIKYEHPHGIPTEIFCLGVIYKSGLNIAKRHGLGEIYAERIISQSRERARARAASLERCYSQDYQEPETCGDRSRSGLDGQRLPNYGSSIGQGETFGIHEDDLNRVDTGFWQWVIEINIAITIVEGVKKAAALLSAGYVAIGLPGIFGGYRSKIDGVDAPQYLIPQLKVFTQQEREFSICFDNDTNPKTIATVRTAVNKTGKLLERKRCQVSVVSWQQPYKGVDDLIYNLGAETYHQTFTERQSLDSWRLGGEFDISQLPQTVVNTRYLDPLVKPDDLAGKLIAIKSAKGTGKTKNYIAKLAAPELDKGRAVLVITHRIQLAKAVALDVGINHISQVKASEIGSLQGYSLCIDSLHPTSQAKFNPAAWDNAIVVIDECEQVLWHMLNSPTCQGNRVSILKTFQKLLRHVTESGGTVILSDADLSKVSIDYIQSLVDNQLDLWLLRNIYNPNKGKRSLFVHKTQAQLLAAAQTAIMNGERVIIHCSAQKTKSMWSSQNIETALLSQFPGKRIIRVDAETVADPTHPAYGCMERINELLGSYDIVIASPTIETGISIDIKHFDSVWALTNGVQTVDAVCQTIERVRDDVPRHICITTGGVTKIGNGSDSIRYLIGSEHSVFKANYQAMSRIDFGESIDGNNSGHLRTWAKYAAKVNQGYNKYASKILDKLAEEGYEIVPVTTGDDDDRYSVPTEMVESATEAIETAKATNYATERQGKMNASNPNDIEFAALKKKTAKTKGERNQESKGLLCRRYLTEDITDNLIIKDDKGWYPQLQLHYYLTIGNKHLSQRDNARLDLLTPDGQEPFKPDSNRLCLSAKVKALQALQIEEFFGVDRVFTDDSLRKWHDRLLSCRLQVKEILGISISPTSHPVRAAQQILRKLGVKLTYLDRIRIDGILVRRYSGVDGSLDGRLDVFSRWLDRDDLALELRECSTSSIDLTPSEMWNSNGNSHAA
jgi:Domain of unknown function (DUF3854)